jgi:hypothetical protein
MRTGTVTPANARERAAYYERIGSRNMTQLAGSRFESTARGRRCQGVM